MEHSPDGTPEVGAHRDLDPCDRREAPNDEQIKLPLIEESLQVDKVRVDQGGYRISKRVEVVDEMVDELLRHERVSIERLPIGRHVVEMPASRYEGETLVVPVVEEVLVTEKRLVLVEEVRITRILGTTHEQRQVTLRKEHVEIERLGAEKGD